MKAEKKDKCIVLARVSTEGQDYTEQVKCLKDAAIADGFTPENIIVINNKESAIKLSEEKRLGLNEMKEALEGDKSITTVYVREVSRIGRRYDVLCNIKAYFVTNRIQLIVCGDTRTELLDAEGNVTLVGNLMFEIACQVAVQEMNDKKIRFAQGVRRAQMEGRLGCGRPSYGYTIKDGRLAINETEAEVVRWVFDTYVNTNASTKSIYRELRDKGTWKTYEQKGSGGNRVSKMLKNLSYSGRHPKLQYPPIINAELQDAAIQKAQNAKQKEKAEHKHVYYASGLVTCECGHRMSADLSYCCYVCPHCNHKISINQLDFVAWNETQVIKVLEMKRDKRVSQDEARRRLQDNEQRIKASEVRLNELEEREESIVDTALYISNKEKREAFISSRMDEIKREQKHLKQTIAKLQSDNDRQTDILSNGSKLSEALYVASAEDDRLRKQIINEAIGGIKVERLDEKRVKFVITPQAAMWGWSVPYTTHYIYDRTKRTHPSLYRVMGEHSEDVCSQVVKRFESYTTAKKRKAK